MKNVNIDPQLLLPKKTSLQMGKYRIDDYLSSGGFGNTYEVIRVLPRAPWGQLVLRRGTLPIFVPQR